MKKITLILALILSTLANPIHAKIPTLGLMEHSTGSLDSGYVLFTQINNKETYLIDKCGYIVQKWISTYKPGFSVYLLPDGNLLRTGKIDNKAFWAGGTGGIIEKMDWESKIVWSYKLTGPTQTTHHDIKPLSNGNILLLVWDKKTKAQAIEVGRTSAKTDSCVWNEKIIEIKPIGKDSAQIVWEWSAWDHLVQDNDISKPNFDLINLRPERLNINYTVPESKIDWLHINTVDYNPELDQIMLSSLYFNEVWVIDHSTTTAQAKTKKGGKSGKGGDILYRWGNPAAYGIGSTVAAQKLFLQHDANWIPKGFPDEGKIIVFNNCRGTKDMPYSSVDIINPPVNSEGVYDNSKIPFGPESACWSYTAQHPQDFYSMNLSGAQRLLNGNTLICDGYDGNFFELDSAKNIVWKYINPVGPSGPINQGVKPNMNLVFRCTFYPFNYSAFTSKVLQPISLIENENTNSENCQLSISVENNPEISGFNFYPNPAKEYINIETELNSYRISMLDIQGRLIMESENQKTISIKDLPNGVYFIYLSFNNGIIKSTKLVVRR